MATQHAALKRLAPPLQKFIVDGFNFCEPDVRHYLLTHAHSDHTTGLNASFDLGTIYCSSITARVLRSTIGTRQKLLCTLEVGETIEVEGVMITALDAGHCPGALMFLFHDLASGHRALHTGDCRASERIRVHAAHALSGGSTGRGAAEGSLTAVQGDVSLPVLDILYLDTTYAQPRWSFPPVEQALDAISRLVVAELEREPRTLFIVGSYQVGKEAAIAAAARASGGRALVPSRRALSLKLCCAWDEALHTETDAADVRVHVSPLGGMGTEAHAEMLKMLKAHGERFAAVVSFRPTGWTFTKAMQQGGQINPKVWAENGGATRMYGYACLVGQPLCPPVRSAGPVGRLTACSLCVAVSHTPSTRPTQSCKRSLACSSRARSCRLLTRRRAQSVSGWRASSRHRWTWRVTSESSIGTFHPMPRRLDELGGPMENATS